MGFSAWLCDAGIEADHVGVVRVAPIDAADKAAWVTGAHELHAEGSFGRMLGRFALDIDLALTDTGAKVYYSELGHWVILAAPRS